MNSKNIDCDDKIKALRKYFSEGLTISYTERIRNLEKLEKAISNCEEKIFTALSKDLNKSVYESFMTELGLVYGELKFFKKNLKKLMRGKKLRTSLTQFPSSSRLHYEPLGLVLIMSPWNYPFQLTMIPLIGAMAAGNTVILKPSAYSATTSNVIEEIIYTAFPNKNERPVEIVMGGRAEISGLLEQRFDYIFFTGSPAVGKVVMKAAAEHITPLTLELGGKSPCIVCEDVSVEKTAKRIMFGKLLNSGQTCVSPDYVLVHANKYEPLIKALEDEIHRALPDSKYIGQNFPKIISPTHYARLKSLLNIESLLHNAKVIGGQCYDEKMQIEPAIITLGAMHLLPNELPPIMTEEIFGPILPVISYRNIDEVIDFVSSKEKPLALYLFTNDKTIESKVLNRVSFGGGCVNDTIVHLSSSHQQFGGVGKSGMGAYHGKKSFETFSHQKHVLKKLWILDLPVRYHPFKKPNETPPRILF